jgi:hypothetical protein
MARRATIDDCRLIELPRVVDVRGSLSFLEGGKHLPFDIKRAFYIYDVPTSSWSACREASRSRLTTGNGAR